MDKKLILDAVKKLIAGVVLVWLLLFLPAGTWHYPGAWLLSAVLFIPVIIMGVVLALKAPDLLRKRLKEKEEQGTQRKVVAMSALMFVGGFVLAGLDFRFEWTAVPDWLVYTAAVIFLLGYGMFAEVLRENAYLSRTVEVQEGQTVVDSGLYGIIRHPMYTATILMFCAMPLVLGSWISFVLFLVYPMILVKRIRNEEQVLLEGLQGYEAYTRKVRWRLLPFVW